MSSAPTAAPELVAKSTAAPGAAEPSAGQPLPPEPRVEWTEALRGQLQPRRSNGPARGFPAPSNDWDELTVALAKARKHSTTAIETSKMAADLVRLATRALEQLEAIASGKRPERAPELEVQAIALRTLWTLYSPGYGQLLSYLAERRDVTFVLEAVLRSADFKVEADYSQCRTNDTVTSWVVRGAVQLLDRSRVEPLRALLASADEEAWQAARERAAALRRGASLPRRCALAYLFPDVPDWANEDAAELLALEDLSCIDESQHGQVSPDLDPGSLPHWTIELIASVTDAPLAEALLERAAFHWESLASYAVELLRVAGPQAFEPITAYLAARKSDFNGREGNTARRQTLQLLSHIVGPAAGELFVSYIDTKDAKTRKLASSYFSDHPEIALTVLPALGVRSSKRAEIARQLLTSLAANHPERVAARAGELSGAPATLLQDLLAEAAGPSEEAGAGELPQVLVSPPWSKKRPKPKATVIAGLSPLPRPPVLLEPFVEEEELDWARQRVADAVQSPDEQKAWLARWNADPVEAATVVADSRFDVAVSGVLQLFGLEALPGLVQSIPHLTEGWFDLPSRLGCVQVAPIIAESLAGRSFMARRAARHWLIEVPETAAVGLIPATLGARGKQRAAGEHALRVLAALGQVDVLEVAGRYSAKVRAAVAGIVERDPLELGPSKAPKMPPWWEPASLPRPCLANGKGLPSSALAHLGTMLKSSSLELPYQGLALVRAACEPSSLGAFGWGLFGTWMRGGAPAGQVWALHALAHLADDTTVGKLGQQILAWRSRKDRSKAQQGLAILQTIGSDMALLHLGIIADKSTNEHVRAFAAQQISEIATIRGLTADEIGDHTVPDLGLGPDGRLHLDYGPRQLTVSLDESLSPVIRDATGKVLQSIPKRRKGDDPAMAKASIKAYQELRKDVETLGKAQINRLERGMTSRRRWDAKAFTRCFAAHPLMVNLAQRIVWALYDDAGAATALFRVGEDRTLADGSDDAFSLPDHASIGVPHPLELTPKVASAWGQLLADYQIVQPFLQLGRPTYQLEPSERRASRLTRADGITVPSGVALGILDTAGWERSYAEMGAVWGYTKKLPGGFEASIGFDFELVPADEPPRSVYVELLHDATLGQLDALTFSELVHDVEKLRG